MYYDNYDDDSYDSSDDESESYGYEGEYNDEEEESLEELEEKAIEFLNRNDFKNACHFLSQALRLDSSYTWLKTLKAECLLHLGRFREAKLLAQEGLYSNQSRSTAILIRSMCYCCLNGFKNVDDTVKQAFDLAPHNSFAKKLYENFKLLNAVKDIEKQANAEYNSEQNRSAYNLYTKAIDMSYKFPNYNASLYTSRAYAIFKLGNTQEAINDCTITIQQNGKYLKAWLFRARCYSHCKKYHLAIHDYKEAYNLDGSNETMNLLNDARREVRKQNARNARRNQY